VGKRRQPDADQLHFERLLAAKKVKLTAGDKSEELQEDRSLFARMLGVAKSRTEINPRETIRKHAFSVVPRTPIAAADGTMLHCSSICSLEKLPANNQEAGH